MGSHEIMLADIGFVGVGVEVKEESRAVIAQWMPGSGAEDYVVSADITATKPCAESAVAACCPPAATESCCPPAAEEGCCPPGC